MTKAIAVANGREFTEGELGLLTLGTPILKPLPSLKPVSTKVENIHISSCYSCKRLALWVHEKLVWPEPSEGPAPNVDLPAHILRDYEEAARILSQSPRGSAALLRLAIQKLCTHLGERGRNINDDIAALVKKGLPERVQKALDVVRVIGNEAVHPGQLDLKDDRVTAEKLFGLVNIIAEVMISQPKHIDAMFEGLPERAREAIEKRDGKK